MDLKQLTHVCLLIVAVVTVISARKRDGKDKSKGRGKSRNKLSEIEKSIAVLQRHALINKKTLYVDDVIDYVCLPNKTDRLVYRFENKTHIFIGFDSLERGRMTEMTWKIKDVKNDIVVLENKSVSELDSSQTADLRRWLKTDVILAAAKLRHENQFIEDIDTCDTSKSITMRFCLIQAFASLAHRLKTVTFHQSCHKQPISR